MIHRATVIDNNDPNKALGVRVSCPSLYGTRMSGWVSACVPVKGSPVPNIGDNVWIMCENGDASGAVWIGRWMLPGGALSYEEVGSEVDISPTQPIIVKGFPELWVDESSTAESAEYALFGIVGGGLDGTMRQVSITKIFGSPSITDVADEVRVANAGLYLISYSWSAFASSAAGTWLQLYTRHKRGGVQIGSHDAVSGGPADSSGSGWAAGGSVTYLFDMAAGDTLRFEMNSPNVSTLDARSRIVVTSVGGAIGPQGPQGIQGPVGTGTTGEIMLATVLNASAPFTVTLPNLTNVQAYRLSTYGLFLTGDQVAVTKTGAGEYICLGLVLTASNTSQYGAHAGFRWNTTSLNQITNVAPDYVQWPQSTSPTFGFSKRRAGTLMRVEIDFTSYTNVGGMLTVAPRIGSTNYPIGGFFFNSTNRHETIHAHGVIAGLGVGAHQITLNVAWAGAYGATLQCDSNDYFNMIVSEVT